MDECTTCLQIAGAPAFPTLKCSSCQVGETLHEVVADRGLSFCSATALTRFVRDRAGAAGTGAPGRAMLGAPAIFEKAL